MAPARLFVAVWPPPQVVEVLAGLPRPPVPGLRWTTPDQWHVTLRFLGQVPVAPAAAALEAAPLAAPVVAVLGPETARFGPAVLHVPVAGLDLLARALAPALAAVASGPEERPFSGHITLARCRRRGPDLRPLVDAPVPAPGPGPWVVDEVTLVRSRRRPEGASYEVVAARSLAGG